MRSNFINISDIASAVGMTDTELMKKLGMDGSVDKEGAIESLRRDLNNPTPDTFEAFCWVAGHYIRNIDTGPTF